MVPACGTVQAWLACVRHTELTLHKTWGTPFIAALSCKGDRILLVQSEHPLRQCVCVTQITRRDVWQIHPQGACNLSRFGTAQALQPPRSPHAVLGGPLPPSGACKATAVSLSRTALFQRLHAMLSHATGCGVRCCSRTSALLACCQEISTASRDNTDRQDWQGQHAA